MNLESQSMPQSMPEMFPVPAIPDDPAGHFIQSSHRHAGAGLGDRLSLRPQDELVNRLHLCRAMPHSHGASQIAGIALVNAAQIKGHQVALMNLPVAGEAVRQRSSSPKLQVLNNALMTAQSGLTLREARADPEYWGQVVESAVGTHLANAAAVGVCQLYHWREHNREVDFVTRAGHTLVAIEVKSGRSRHAQPGLGAFAVSFKPQRSLLVGGVA